MTTDIVYTHTLLWPQKNCFCIMVWHWGTFESEYCLRFHKNQLDGDNDNTWYCFMNSVYEKSMRKLPRLSHTEGRLEYLLRTVLVNTYCMFCFVSLEESVCTGRRRKQNSFLCNTSCQSSWACPYRTSEHRLSHDNQLPWQCLSSVLWGWCGYITSRHYKVTEDFNITRWPGSSMG